MVISDMLHRDDLYFWIYSLNHTFYGVQSTRCPPRVPSCSQADLLGCRCPNPQRLCTGLLFGLALALEPALAELRSRLPQFSARSLANVAHGLANIGVTRNSQIWSDTFAELQVTLMGCLQNASSQELAMSVWASTFVPLWLHFGINLGVFWGSSWEHPEGIQGHRGASGRLLGPSRMPKVNKDWNTSISRTQLHI